MILDYDMWRNLMLIDHKKSTPKSYGLYMKSLKTRRRGGAKRK